ETEERYGDYQLVVDEIAERLLDVRETYASSLDERTAEGYRPGFNRMALGGRALLPLPPPLRLGRRLRAPSRHGRERLLVDPTGRRISLPRPPLQRRHAHSRDDLRDRDRGGESGRGACRGGG